VIAALASAVGSGALIVTTVFADAALAVAVPVSSLLCLMLLGKLRPVSGYS
jgi:hypothetical protein